MYKHYRQSGFRYKTNKVETVPLTYFIPTYILTFQKITTARAGDVSRCFLVVLWHSWRILRGDREKKKIDCTTFASFRARPNWFMNTKCWRKTHCLTLRAHNDRAPDMYILCVRLSDYRRFNALSEARTIVKHSPEIGRSLSAYSVIWRKIWPRYGRTLFFKTGRERERERFC